MPKREADLYDRNISRFRDLMREDKDAAFGLFGMTLINSINPAERAEALRHWGFEVTEAVDYYNLGCHSAHEENWSEAIVHFKHAIQMDPNLTQAIYNMAICYEKTGHMPQARSTWEVYVDVTSDETEKRLIGQRIQSL